MAQADAVRRMRVRANADTPDQATNARERGAEGIGLCRTEHMFLGEERVGAVRQMIFAETEPRRSRPRTTSCSRSSASDFVGIFRAMSGLPVTVRLLDPPLHEFLPEPGRSGRRGRARPRSAARTSPSRSACCRR